MASLEDVQNSLVQFIAGLIYPDGIEEPATTSIDVSIYAGWPVPDHLDKALQDHKAHVTIFNRPEERNTSRGLNESVTVTTGTDTGTTLKVVGIQEQLFQISVWAETPDARTELGSLIDVNLKDAKRVLLPDGTWGRLIYRDQINIDDTQKAAVYAKHIFYYVEYATTKVTTDYVIKEAVVNVTSQITPL